MGWSRILTDLQKMRAAEADGGHSSLPGSLCNESFHTVAVGILTARDRTVPNLKYPGKSQGCKWHRRKSAAGV